MSEAKAFYNRYWNDEHVIKNAFDDHPGEWEEKEFRYIMEFFGPHVSGHVLDFGCGDGQFSNLLTAYCDEVTGVDISERAIEKARKKYPGKRFFIWDDNGAEPFKDNTFDVVCMIGVLEHILDTESVLENVYSLLKDTGKLLIATNELTPIKAILIASRYLDDYFYPTSPHIRYFTKKNLRDLLSVKKFDVIGYRKHHTYFGFIPQGQMVVATKRLEQR